MNGENLMAAVTALPIAAHVVTRRTGYVHHGIYVGHGRVVHYRGLVHGWRSGPVERIGENAYRILSNNCEHFCEWCLNGRNRSLQVEA